MVRKGSLVTYGIMAALAALALPAEVFAMFALWFAPGWANRWPGGLPIHVVWPAGLSALVFLTTMTVAMAVIAGACLWADRPLGRRAFGLWLVVTGTLALAAAVWVYSSLHAHTLTMWPNGYNP
jgi:hypothetical protein